MGNAFPSTSGKRWRALSYESCFTSTSTKRLGSVSRPRIHHLLQTFRGNACPGWAQPAPNTARLSVRRTPGAKKKRKPNNTRKNIKIKKEKKKEEEKGNKKDIKLPVAAVPRWRGGSVEAAAGPAFPSRPSAPKQSSESTAMQMGGYEFFAAA